MKKYVLTAIAAGMLSTLAPTAMAQNVAIVNGKAVPKARLEALAAQKARAGRPSNPDELRQEVITLEILAQEAQARGLDTTDTYKAQVENAKQVLLINELFNEFIKNNPVSDEEIKAEYDKWAAANGGKEYRARHILVEKEDQAKDIIAQLKKGKKFEELAKKLSKDPGSGANGGDLDWAAPSNYVKEFSDAMVALGKGKTTETPVKSQFGYHIIRLEDVRDIKLPAFEEVKPQIAQALPQQKAAKFRDDLVKKAKVE
jgi:peptidyl-prolyl cis-trans isomerase C